MHVAGKMNGSSGKRVPGAMQVIELSFEALIISKPASPALHHFFLLLMPLSWALEIRSFS